MVNRYGNRPEPIVCSAGGVPYNKAHLDAKDARIRELERDLFDARAGISSAESERDNLKESINDLSYKLEALREVVNVNAYMQDTPLWKEVAAIVRGKPQK
jgi:uncharacterized protein YlxW (UPF0749 family)